MLFWDTKDGSPNCPVTELRLSHKRCEKHFGEDRLGLSAELTWFASREASLYRLASMLLDYSFSGEQSRRLALIAWACPILCSAHKRRADSYHRLLTGS